MRGWMLQIGRSSVRLLSRAALILIWQAHRPIEQPSMLNLNGKGLCGHLQLLKSRDFVLCDFLSFPLLLLLIAPSIASDRLPCILRPLCPKGKEKRPTDS